MRKIKQGILLALLIAFGQFVYLQFLVDSGMPSIIRCFIMIVSITFLGDIVGHFVLRLPMYNYAQLYSYFKVEIINQIGFMAVFSAAWCGISEFLKFWELNKEILIFDGGLLPALYYIIIHIYRFSKTDSRTRRSRPKI